MAEASPRPPELRAASLFDVDPELGEGLHEHQLARVRPRALVAVFALQRGPWSPVAPVPADAHPFALLIADGLVIREQVLAGSVASELVGPGDIVDAGPQADPLVPGVVHWTVPDAATVAVLDDRVLGVIRASPTVASVLLSRAVRRACRLSTHRAITQLPRVDQRLLAFFAHMAERWGRVAAAGLIVPLQLTHETLGRLIGARRPTVSLALKELAASGLLERRADGAWLLRHAALDLLAEAHGAEPWQPADARAVPTVQEPSARAAGAGLPLSRSRW